MSIYTTEIASESISSDNPVHQRLLKAYLLVKDMISDGDLLEIGCGEGRGVQYLDERTRSFTGIDKISEVIDDLSKKHPSHQFFQMIIPPIEFPDNSFDTIISFQVIEHIKKDRDYLSEIYRILKPGGTAYITTPNRKLSLTRNPWHVREYLSEELKDLALNYFDDVKIHGIHGNEKVMEYYEKNKESVARITRLDVLDLQHRLPRWMIRIPYDILNRINRNKLESGNDDLVSAITTADYYLSDDPDSSLDLFLVAKKL